MTDMAVDWRKIRDSSMDVALYIQRKTRGSDIFERAASSQQLLDTLAKEGYIGLIPNEGTDEYSLIFKKRPPDYDEVLGPDASEDEHDE